jgi:hypothetical protein
MTAPQPPEANPSVTLQQFKGLNNTVAPERLAPGELQRAINIDIDDSGQVRRRRGATRLLTGQFHSLFEAADGTVYVVKDGVLCRLLPSNQTVALNATVGTRRVAYVQVGQHIYFSSGGLSGVIYPDDQVGPWGASDGQNVWVSPVVNPSPTYHEVRGKLLGPPPMATALAYYNGRIYLAVDKTLWATELYLYHYVDKTRNFQQYESEITMVEAVGNGLFVGTETAVYFLSGAFGEMRRETVMRVGAVRGSVCRIPSEAISPPQLRENGIAQTRPAIVFLTEDGVCAGLDSGACYNITESQLVFPAATEAAAMYRQQDGMGQYVAVTNTGGAPSSSARIGDYVDAEIRRFSGA